MALSRLTRLLLLALIIAVGAGCDGSKPKPRENDLVHIQSRTKPHSKKVIVFVADSLMYQSIDKGLELGKLPTFKLLVERGQYYKNLVSSFPTMSVTIDSSLLTGTYPDRHRVPGLIWYAEDEKRIVNYGTGSIEVLRQGAGAVLDDALVRLNGDHLSKRTPTIYERLRKQGRTSASVNGLIYRGDTGHVLTIPKWMQASVSLPEKIRVQGPDFMTFGALSNPLEGMKRLPDNVAGSLGFNNEFAIGTVAYLIEQRKLPDFTYVYLPDQDHELHKKGPSHLDGLIKLDGQLQRVLQAFGSPEAAQEQAVILIVGDSGMSSILPRSGNPVIDLTDLFQRYAIMRPGETASQKTDIALAVNETMAYVYNLKPGRSLKELVRELQREPRIELISWKEGKWIHVARPGSGSEFKYKPGGRAKDVYGQKWTLGPNAALLDVKVDLRKHVSYGQYPDGLRRLYGALHSHDGEFIVITAKQGYEFTGHSSPKHRGGGGHGSLHETESIVPLIVYGTDRKPERLRIVDLQSYILNLLRVEE